MADLKFFTVMFVLICSMLSVELQKCDERKDVVFLVDSSGSVKSRNFQKVRTFLVDFVQKLDIGESKIRLSVVRFSSTLTKILWLNESFNKTEITNTIKTMRYNGGGTKTGQALRFANQKVLDVTNGDRPEVPDLVFVITDGKSKNPFRTQSEAKLLHDKGVDVVAIGVGSRVDVTELLNIASVKDFALRVDNFDQLKNESLHQSIFKAACTGLKPTTSMATTEAQTISYTMAFTTEFNEEPTMAFTTEFNEEPTMAFTTEFNEEPTMAFTTEFNEERSSAWPTLVPAYQSVQMSSDTTTMVETQSSTSVVNITMSYGFEGSSDSELESTLPDVSEIDRKQYTSTEQMTTDDLTTVEPVTPRNITSGIDVTEGAVETSSIYNELNTTMSSSPDNSTRILKDEPVYTSSTDALKLFKDWRTVAGLTAFTGLVIMSIVGAIIWAVRRKLTLASKELKEYD